MKVTIKEKIKDVFDGICRILFYWAIICIFGYYVHAIFFVAKDFLK